MSQTTTRTTYTISHVPGHGPNDHFGREILSRVGGEGNSYRTLTAARQALRRARADHGGSQPGRFDIVREPDGKRFSWE